MTEHIKIQTPDWLREYAKDYQQSFTDDEVMSFVIGASKINVDHHQGGPFAAAVVGAQSRELISIGVNLVTVHNLSVLHAEIVALSIAQNKLGTYDLGATHLEPHILFTTTEPCAMCLGAIPWSGVKSVVAGARDSDATRVGFDEGAKPENWMQGLNERGISTVADVCRQQAADVLEHYQKTSGHIYNSRE